MNQRQELPNGYTDVDFGNKKLIFNERFSEILSDRKDLHSFLKAKKNLDQNPGLEQTVREGDLAVTSKFRQNEKIVRLVKKSSYYKVDKNNESLFVKRTPTKELVEVGGGRQEVVDMLEAKGMISDLKWADVMDYQLGYEDEYDSYVVTPWRGFFNHELSEYLKMLKTQPGNEDKAKEIEDKVEILKKRFAGKFWELRADNMFYDEKSSKIYIFDLIKKPENKPDKTRVFVE